MFKDKYKEVEKMEKEYKNVASITVPASIEHLSEVLDLVRNCISENGGDELIGMNVEIICEEIFTNIASYAYENEKENKSENKSENKLENKLENKATVQCLINKNPLEIKVIFEDSGKQYNPLEHEDPDINAPLEEREIGGLGILMAKKMMDEVSYEYKDHKNIFSISKNVTKKDDNLEDS